MISSAGWGLNPSKRIRCFSPRPLEPTNKGAIPCLCYRLPNAAAGGSLEAQGQIPAICVAISFGILVSGGPRRSSQNCSRGPGWPSTSNPLRICREAYQSRTAHHVLILRTRRKSSGLDLLYLAVPSPRSFHHVVRQFVFSP